ncbi:MAG: hypothetical protein QM296_08020 [Bacillota bacterium]|jgi:Fe2+ transport system protein B|nr:hypothetical protein [Bacillota bacterium]
MPNFESLFSAIVGAIVGGVFAGFGAYVSFSRIIAILQTKISGFEASCAACKQNFEARIFRLEGKEMKEE